MAGLLDYALMPARAMMAQPPDTQGLGILGDIHKAIDPVRALGGYGNMAAMALPMGGPMKLYQGRSVYNKGSAFYTQDKEWARQFTQSGLDKEIAQTSIDPKHIYKPEKPIYAGDMDAVDLAVAEARKKGFRAVELIEARGMKPGEGEPASYFVFDRSSFRK